MWNIYRFPLQNLVYPDTSNQQSDIVGNAVEGYIDPEQQQQQQPYDQSEYQQQSEYEQQPDYPTDPAAAEQNYEGDYQETQQNYDATVVEQQPYETQYNEQYAPAVSADQQQQQPSQEYAAADSYYSEEPGQNYYPNENPPLTTDITANNEYGDATSNYANAEYYNEYDATTTYGAAPIDNNTAAEYAEDESSATTYSENVNQLAYDGSSKIGGGDEVAVAPNYLESETDESAQQVLRDGGVVEAAPNNDESDFDFSANWNIKNVFLSMLLQNARGNSILLGELIFIFFLE